MQRYAIQLSKLKSKSTYGSSGEVDIPPCPRSYHTPMTNALRNHDIQSIEAVRDEILAVSYRTQWEVQRLTERLIEVEIEMQGKTHDQLQDELQDELQGEPQGELEQGDLSAWVQKLFHVVTCARNFPCDFHFLSGIYVSPW